MCARRQQRQRMQRLEAKDAVPQQQQLLHRQVAGEGVHQPGHGQPQRRAAGVKHVEDEVRLKLLDQVLKGLPRVFIIYLFIIFLLRENKEGL